MTSTSSLGYQFHRKFIPLKMSREKRDEYYAKTEKKRSKSANKQSSCVFKKERERDRYREERHQKPQTISEEELPEKREAAVKPVREDDGIRQLYSQSKYKRQEGGRTSVSHEREVSDLLHKKLKPHPNGD